MTWNSFLYEICRLGKGILAKAGRFTGAFCRYSVILAAGAVLSAALTILFARLDGEGRTALTVYAETASVIPEGEKAETAFQEHPSEMMKEGQELAGITVAEGVFAMQRARQQRQEDIEKAKAATQQTKEEGKEETAAKAAKEEAGRVVEAGKQKRDADAAGEGGPGIKAEEPGAKGQEEGARQASAKISCSQKDYEVLQRIVEAEAGICDIRGRILVANVVINRVKSEEFPNTITGVVYQKSQFSPVYDGTLNTCTVTPETVEAVDRALAGEDYSQGALYFMNRRRSRAGNVSWFDNSLTYLFQYDRHEFFK